MSRSSGMTAPGSHPGVSVLRLQGENDASVAHRVRTDLASAVGCDAPVVVDLSGVTSLDAAVIRLLLDALAEAESQECPFVLLVPDDGSAVRRLFQITGLAGLLPVATTWEEALARTGGQAGAEPGWTMPLS